MSKLKFSQQMKQDALTRLYVVWKTEKDGRSKQVFYSLDKDRDRAQGNPEPGIRRLEQKVVEKYRGEYRYATLYKNDGSGSGERIHAYDSHGNKIFK